MLKRISVFSWKKIFLKEILLASSCHFSLTELNQSWFSVLNSYICSEGNTGGDLLVSASWCLRPQWENTNWGWNNLKICLLTCLGLILAFTGAFIFSLRGSFYLISLHRLFQASLQHERRMEWWKERKWFGSCAVPDLLCSVSWGSRSWSPAQSQGAKYKYGLMRSDKILEDHMGLETLSWLFRK